MNPPIDILAIAGTRYHEAGEWVRNAGMLNHSAVASRHYEVAQAEFLLAAQDRTRAQNLMLELAQAEKV